MGVLVLLICHTMVAACLAFAACQHFGECTTGGKDVVFFMHGILDTSMGWVSNGVTGSQAFAAYDQGFDVWLGNSRANPPREHESGFSISQSAQVPVAGQYMQGRSQRNGLCTTVSEWVSMSDMLL